MIPYEILIRGNADGTYSGSHAIDTAGGEARAITPADLSDIAPAINAAFLAAKESAESELFTEKIKVVSLESYKAAMVAKVASALASNDLEKIQALAVEFLTPEAQLKRAAKLAEYEALKAELGIQ